MELYEFPTTVDLGFRLTAESFSSIPNMDMPDDLSTTGDSRQKPASIKIGGEAKDARDVESNIPFRKARRIPAFLRKFMRQPLHPVDDEERRSTDLRICKPFKSQGSSIAKIHKVDECPRGYPHFAALLNSDENFTMFRRFGYLQCRLILEKQTRLAMLECQLDELDKQLAESERDRIYLHTVDDDEGIGQTRATLVSKIEHTFHDYGQTL